MSVAAVIAALQTLHAGITGVASAPTTYPGAIDTADLPMVLTFPGPATSHQEAMNSLRRSDREYIVRLYVAPDAGGVEDENTQTVITMIQRFIEAYIDPDNIRLVNSGGVQATIHISLETPVRDSGIVSLAYAGVDYRGCEFKVGVFEKW